MYMMYFRNIPCCSIIRTNHFSEPPLDLISSDNRRSTVSISKRIERALDSLRQRYGVSGGLTSESKIAKIRTRPRVAMSVASLKAFNEDLNTLEVYAHAHDELDKLSGQLILDTANRLPGLL